MSETADIQKPLPVEEARLKDLRGKATDYTTQSIFEGLEKDPDIRIQQVETDRRLHEIRKQLKEPNGANEFKRHTGWKNLLKKFFKK